MSGGSRHLMRQPTKGNEMATVSKCECGRRKSQYATYCRKCSKEREDKRNEENRAILATGVCPKCGSALKRNLSLTGWWQCEQFGSVGFRARDNDPQCSFDMTITGR